MGGGSKTTTTSTDPWEGQSPYLEDIFTQAQNLYGRGPQQYFPGQTVAPFSPQTQTGLDMEMSRAMGGDPSQYAMGNYLTGAMSQPNIDPRMIAEGGMGAMGNLGVGSQYLQSAGAAGPGYGEAMNMAGVGGDIGLPGAAQFAGGVTNPYTHALMGSTGYGGLSEARDYYGTPQTGALPASSQFVEQALGAVRPDFMGTATDIQGADLSGVDPIAYGELGKTAGGGYMPGQNPYLDQLYQTGSQRIQEQFQEDVLPQLAGQFGAAGRTGSGAQALMTGRAAGDVAQEMAGLYGDIYAPAYEAERGRQLDAAGTLGEIAQRGDIAGMQTAADIYGQDLGQQMGAAELGGDLYSRLNQAELSRLSGGADLYTGGRGLGQEAMQAAGQLGLGGGNLAADLYRAGLTGDINRRQLAGNLYGEGMNRMATTGANLADLGIGGMGALSDLYSNIGDQGYRAATLAPQYQGMQYTDIDRMLRGGGQIEDQAQRMMDDARMRWEFTQNAPWQNLGQYSNIIQGMPGGYGTESATGPGGSRVAGAIGGGLTGAAATPAAPWLGAGVGAVGGILAT